jgi:hypothetical protein
VSIHRKVQRARWDHAAAWQLAADNRLTATERYALELLAHRAGARTRAGTPIYMEKVAHELRRTVAHAQRVTSSLARRGLLDREHGRRARIGDKWVTYGATRYRLAGAALALWQVTTTVVEVGANPPRHRFVTENKAAARDDLIDLARVRGHALASVSGTGQQAGEPLDNAAETVPFDTSERCWHGRRAVACLVCSPFRH